jgi:hypothetical protein
MGRRKPKPQVPDYLDPEEVKKRVDAFIDNLVDAEIGPYLHLLLDTAQLKTKYDLHFSMAMGSTCLYCEAPWQKGAWDTPEEVGYGICRDGAKEARCREKFPELVELFRFVHVVGDTIFCDDMYPRVGPRKDDGTQDPADYVEYGPNDFRCNGPKCTFTGIEDDFLYSKKKRYCQDCFNGRGPWKGGK